MKVFKHNQHAGRKFFLILLLALLAFQSLGLNGLAAPGASGPYLQGGTPIPNTIPLSCGAVANAAYCNIQIVLMLDDSGSMKANDLGRLRNKGAINVVNILADQYYAAAQSYQEATGSPLPDVRVAVIHFSDRVVRKSPWFSIDPNNVPNWKKDLSKEIGWPEQDSAEYTDFYSKKQYTDFKQAFEDASQLLQLQDAKDVQGDCTRRAILLFTDGTPESAINGILTGPPLDSKMKDISEIISKLNTSMGSEPKPAIFITGFKLIKQYLDVWNKPNDKNNSLEKKWNDIANLSQEGDIAGNVERVKLVGMDKSLDDLPARMDEITASVTDVIRFAKNHPANSSASYPVYIPSFTESIRFTLYNSDIAAQLEITDPDNNVVIPPAEIPPGPSGTGTPTGTSGAGTRIENSGAGSPIQVWQIYNPKAGPYKVTVRNATRGGIITWMYAYKKDLSAQFDNQPGSFEPGQQGDIKFRLVDSDGNIVSDKLNLRASITQFGETESPLNALTQDGDTYSLSWTPKNTEPAIFKMTLSDGSNELLNCSLDFDFIGPTPTPTSTPTSTATSTPTATATFTATPTATTTPPPPPPPSVLAIFPQCVAPGDSVTLPMYLQYGGERAKLASLDWQAGTTILPENQSIDVRVDPINSDRGEFQVVVGPVGTTAKSLQLHLKALENADGQSVTIFDVASAIPVSAMCNVDCTDGLWAAWFLPLVILLLGLMILLLVLRFRPRNDPANLQAQNDIYRTREWHILFWPLLVLFLLLLLVRWTARCPTIPPWLFLVSILVWLVFALLIRFFPGRDPSQQRPWWLLLLLVVLGFFGYLAITNPALSLLWLLLFLLLAWVILWYLKPDVPPDPAPNPNPVPPFDFHLVIGPATEFLNRSVTVPVQVFSKGNESAISSLKWDVKDWNIIATSPGWELAQNVERSPEEKGKGSLIISDIDDDINTVMIEARAEVGVGDQWTSTLQAAATIQIMRIIEPAPLPIVVHELAILNLDFSPTCVSYNETITLPIHFEYHGKEIQVLPPTFSPSVQVDPAGQVEAKVEQEEGGEHKLIIGPIKYDKANPARKIQVQLRAETRLSNGRSVEAFGRTTIQICPPDDLTDLEGIGEKVQDLLYANNIFTFKQLAQADHKIINEWLNLAGWKMMDAKTWPQQAKLAAIAREYGKEDKENYEAYKAWLKDGIEPDEHNDPEKPRRPEALVWNRVAGFTPLVLNLELHPMRVLGEVITLPVKLNYEESEAWLSDVEWKVSAKALRSDGDVGVEVKTNVHAVNPAQGEFKLEIGPVQDVSASSIQVIAQAMINGRSIEFYDNSIEVQVSHDLIPMPPVVIPVIGGQPEPDDLTELEGVGKATEKILNANGIFTFQQLAQANMDDITTWLNDADLKMLDPKTWPQQAKLADIARRYGKEADRQNYAAYKAWLRNGIEPDEHEKDEKERRTGGALVWNRIAECTPVALSLALGPSSAHYREATILPLQLNREADRVRLSTVEWQVNARTMPGGKEVQATVRNVNETSGTYELVINPIQDEETREVQVTVQALVNGRSIEIYYGKAITVQVSPPPAADDLTELEGIGKATENILNENGIFTFKQLARVNKDEVTTWLNAGDLKMMDPKTWPQQAKLADIANKYGREEDRQSYEAYKAWLKGGIEPDEYDKDEKDRRPVALVWPLAADSIPDNLEELEGIGKDIAQVLNDKGIFTFKQLAKADSEEISAWLDECGYQRMDSKTWPQQAKLADIAREFGMEEDRRSYEAYKAWLKGGIEPDEYQRDKKDRRSVALTWYGSAELTEKAYPEIFG